MNAVVAGGAAGTCEVITTYPLDVVKTRSQLATGQTPGIWATLRNIAATEGPLGLYRTFMACFCVCVSVCVCVCSLTLHLSRVLCM
jgi:Mitochondrial carrier protein